MLYELTFDLFQPYVFDSASKFASNKSDITLDEAVNGWRITAYSNVKNIIVYKKVIVLGPLKNRIEDIIKLYL